MKQPVKRSPLVRVIALVITVLMVLSVLGAALLK